MVVLLRNTFETLFGGSNNGKIEIHHKGLGVTKRICHAVSIKFVFDKFILFKCTQNHQDYWIISKWQTLRRRVSSIFAMFDISAYVLVSMISFDIYDYNSMWSYILCKSSIFHWFSLCPKKDHHHSGWNSLHQCQNNQIYNPSYSSHFHIFSLHVPIFS